MKKLNQKKRSNGAGAVVPSASSRLSVYDGREFAGYLLPVGETGFRAYDSDDRLIGTFTTQREAARAIPIVRGVS
jgi:hypothetical protein